MQHKRANRYFVYSKKNGRSTRWRSTAAEVTRSHRGARTGAEQINVL